MEDKTIGIIDYGAGNLGSVKKALDYLSVPSRIIGSPDETLETVRGVILPGVGAFGAAMAKLEKRGFLPLLRNHIAANRPFLGICLGMQLLLEGSSETENVPGIGVIGGTCRRFTSGKVPHMGWNAVEIESGATSRLFKGIASGSYFYFIHSYYVEETDAALRASVTSYHVPFTSAFEKENVCAVQFHPEKSGDVGLALLRNWCRLG